MLTEKKPSRQTSKMLSLRVDDELFYTLKALSLQTEVDCSTIGRIVLADFLLKARENPPYNVEEIKALL